MVARGHVQNGVVVLDDGVRLPEGQKVTVTTDEMAPGGSIPLFADSSSSKSGPIVRPGISLTVLDGDLQPGGWMYLVGTDEGLKGWVSEKRLRLKF